MRNHFIAIFLFFILTISACTGQQDVTPSPTIGGDEVIITATSPPAEESQEPASLPGLVIILKSPDAEPEELVRVQSELEPIVAREGYQLEVRQDLSPESAPPELALVVLVGSSPFAADLISNLPEVNFLTEAGTGLPLEPNLIVLEGGGESTHQAFLAGYIAGVQSEEWRIGLIATNDNEGIQYRTAFLNGVIYFCGACQPIYPPFGPYPVYVELPVGSDQAAIEAAAEQLIGQGVNMIHVSPHLQSDAFYQYLAQRGVYLIGTEPPPTGLEGNWVASVLMTSSTTLTQAAGLILSGQELPVTGGGIEVSYAGISQARLDHFEEILQKLQSGEIDPVGNAE